MANENYFTVTRILTTANIYNRMVIKKEDMNAPFATIDDVIEFAIMMK